jgi:DNA-binding GntR family transcriptional regulator
MKILGTEMEKSDVGQDPTELNERKSSVEAMQSKIIRRICFREYPPGSQLKEAKLAKEFGVSRTPVRDAISRINHLGLVETRNGVGTVVIELSDEQIRHVYEMRLHLATLIGVMSPRPITKADKSRVAELLDEAIVLKENFSPRRYVELNHQLHNLVADLIGNSLLRSFWRQAYYQAASTWYRIATLAETDAASGLVQELHDLNEAILQGDPSAVGFVQRIHIGYGFQRIEEHLLIASSD